MFLRHKNTTFHWLRQITKLFLQSRCDIAIYILLIIHCERNLKKSTFSSISRDFATLNNEIAKNVLYLFLGPYSLPLIIPYVLKDVKS